MTTPTNARSQGGAESAITDEQIRRLFVEHGHLYAGWLELGRSILALKAPRRALAAPASAQEALRAAIDGLTDYAPHHSGNGMQRGGKYVLRSDVLAALAATRAPSAAVQQGESPSEKQKKLMELADRIDHEELWRWAGMDHHKMTPEQQDRMDAGVALRRYARLWAPGRWLIFPPVGPVNFSASTLDKVYEMAKKDEDRAALASAQPKTGESNV